MYRVNNYKLISDLHRKLSRLTTTCCQSQANVAQDGILNKLPASLSVTKKDFRHINSEYSAILRLLSRTLAIPSNEITKVINDLVVRCQKPMQNRGDGRLDANKKDPKHPSYQSDGKHDPPDDEKDPEKEKMLAFLSKTIFTIFLIFTLAGLLMPNKNRPEGATRYVSWNEFVHHMLAVGEVREIIIHPDLGECLTCCHETSHSI